MRRRRHDVASHGTDEHGRGLLLRGDLRLGATGHDSRWMPPDMAHTRTPQPPSPDMILPPLTRNMTHIFLELCGMQVDDLCTRLWLSMTWGAGSSAVYEVVIQGSCSDGVPVVAPLNLPIRPTMQAP